MSNEDIAHRDDITIGEEAVSQVVRPGLQIGHLIPDFRLHTIDGTEVSPADYKERKNLVILFCNPSDSEDLAVLAELKKRYHSLTDMNAEVLGVASGPLGEFRMCSRHMHLPFLLLGDIKGEAKCSYCVAGAMLFVADRFGEIRMQSAVNKENADEVLDNVESTLGLIEIECPECGVSSWPVG